MHGDIMVDSWLLGNKDLRAKEKREMINESFSHRGVSLIEMIIQYIPGLVSYVVSLSLVYLTNLNLHICRNICKNTCWHK